MQFNSYHDENEEGSDFRNVRAQGVSNRLLQVVKDQAALFHSSDDGRKVVIEQNHVGGLLGDIRSGDSHGDTDVGLLEGGRVVDTVSGDSHDGAAALTAFDDFQFLLRRRSGKDDLGVVSQDVIQFFFTEFLQLGSTDDGSLCVARVDLTDWNAKFFGQIFDGLVAFGNDADRFGNGFGSDGVISGDHDDFDSGRAAHGNGVGHCSTRRVDHGHHAEETEAFDRKVDVVGVELEADREIFFGEFQIAETENAFAETSEAGVDLVEVFLPDVGEWFVAVVDPDGGASIDYLERKRTFM